VVSEPLIMKSDKSDEIYLLVDEIAVR
jgi:hypothetical protein